MAFLNQARYQERVYLVFLKNQFNHLRMATRGVLELT